MDATSYIVIFISAIFASIIHSTMGFHGHQRLFEAFMKALDNGTEPEVSAESASIAVNIICAAYKSAREGKPVKL